MIVTTTPNIEGKRIVRYCGVIAGEAILGANIFKDIFTISCIKRALLLKSMELNLEATI